MQQYLSSKSLSISIRLDNGMHVIFIFIKSYYILVKIKTSLNETWFHLKF